MLVNSAFREESGSMFDVKKHLAGAETFAETACGRRGDDHRFPEASALREKVEANGA
jgi:hypothetical protein